MQNCWFFSHKSHSRSLKPQRPSVSTDVCTIGEDDCLCGECVTECDDGPIENTLCNKFCKYSNGASPPRNLFLAPNDGYEGDIRVVFGSIGSKCTVTIGMTRLGVYVIQKPANNSNCDGPLINPDVYITRISLEEEHVMVHTSCSSALYVGQVIDEKYVVAGYCNSDRTCGIIPPT